MLSPIKTVFMYYPIRSFVTISLMVVISVIAFYVINKEYKNERISKQNSIILWLLINYSILLLFFTVLGRRSLDYYRYNFNLGYSYYEVFILGKFILAPQILMNILMFIPIGIMCSLISGTNCLTKNVLFGVLFSLIIEILQLLLKRGYFEFDDLLSNVLGNLIGYIIIYVFRKTIKVR